MPTRRGLVASSAALVLVFVDFLDELGAGLPPVSAADIRDELALAYGGAALVLLVAPMLLSLVIEGPLLLLSDRWRRDRMAALGMLAMGLCMLLAACAASAWTLALAIGGWATASGIACGLSQGALMDAYPEERERWMTRWTLMGALGDTLSPALVLGSVALGFGWRGALVVAAVLHLLQAIVLARAVRSVEGAGTSVESDDEEDDAPLLDRLRAGLRDRTLLAWLGGCALCCLLDELFVAFGAMFMRDAFGADVATQTAAFTICAIASAVGLALSDRLLRRVDPIRLLRLSSLACAIAFVLWLSASTVAGSVVALALVGAFAAPLYPICAARAYAARPGEAGLVAAVDQLFSPLAIVAPIAVGLLADRFGVLPALTVLLLQPLGVGAIGLAYPRTKSRESSPVDGS
ncbi:MAG TPA: MFS transporter [Enhygromyxa sp.]|nr:MFS transporter [Enhygromyxa sp.]